jgi:HNH endonuclease
MLYYSPMSDDVLVEHNGRLYLPEEVPAAVCTYADCAQPALCKGLCRLHYDRARNGTPMGRMPNLPREGPCLSPECPEPRYMRGLCAAHYSAQRFGPRLTLEDRFWRKVPNRPEDPAACWEWAGSRGSRGYGVIRDGKPRQAHRVAWEIANGPIPEDLVVRHRVCGNPICVRVEHLALGTHQDNADDRIRHGRSCRGEEQALARLTEDLVREIRGSSESTNALARRLKVGTSTVRDIRKGRTWAWVE